MHRNCEQCKRGTPSTFEGIGNPRSDVLVIEEQPFNISKLSRELVRAGFSMDEVYMTSVVKCRSKKKISDKQIKLCKEFLMVENSTPKLIILMGSVACKAFLERTGGVNKFRGYVIPSNKFNCNIVTTFSLDQSQVHYLEPVFRRDLKIARKVLDQKFIESDIRTDNNVILSHDDVIDFLKMIKEEKKPFALDWETKGLKPYNKGNHIISCGISTDKYNSYTFLVEKDDLSKSSIQEALKELLESDCKKMFFNYKFEKLWAKERLSIDIQNNVYDVMYMSYILDSRRGVHSLDHQAFVRLCLGKLKEVDKYKKDMVQCPIDLLHKYNGLDAKLTFALYQMLETLMDENDWKVYFMMLDGAEATLKSEMKGALIDIDILNKNKKKVQREKQEANLILSRLDEVTKFQKIENKTINLNSTQQVSKVMFDILKLNGAKKTVTGAKSIDAEVLERFGDVPFCNHLLRYRKASKLLSTYLEGFEDHIYDDGLLHTNYNLTFTETGRLSSDSPNLQNFPKRDNPFVREMFTVPPDHVLMSFDYKGAEVCCMAMESKDRELIRQVNAHYDMHQFWADRLSQVLTKKINRFDAKNGFVFPSFYGAGFKSIARNLGVHESGVEQSQDELFRMYPFIKRWQKRLKLFYNKNHYVQSLLGRKRYAPLDYNQMINTPIQSLASDFCLLSMIKASREGYKIPLIIHDDITLYVHESEILKTYKRIKKIMTQWDFDFLNVNMEIECSIGRNWFKQKPLELKRKPKKCQEFA